MFKNKIKLLDCTLRDGGYYNSWDFSVPLINQYLEAMAYSNVDIVELGFRSLINKGYKGACAYTTDSFLKDLNIPDELILGVMINGGELAEKEALSTILEKLFPFSSSESPVSLVRIACHLHEFEYALEAVNWLKEKGYLVGVNLMQIASRTEVEVKSLARLAEGHKLDVLYFADSLGGLTSYETSKIINWLQSEWSGELGIHTHDNLGLALTNTLKGLEEGVSWVDATVTGMGRGPGNARTEEVIIEIAEMRNQALQIVPIMNLIEKHFRPMQKVYGWGTNPYYYLSGKFNIHPTYIQEMLSDLRYSNEDILAVISHLRANGGSEFSKGVLNMARHFYHGTSSGKWSSVSLLKGRNVLLLGTGPGVDKHQLEIERFIVNNNAVVIALNTQASIAPDLIDVRIACHPVRLLADCNAHTKLPQPLIIPFSILPAEVKEALVNKEVYDFGLNVQIDTFKFNEFVCTIPSPLVLAYALAITASGQAKKIYLAGFDGYIGEDSRNDEANKLFKQFQATKNSMEIVSITPTRYDIPKVSIYGVID